MRRVLLTALVAGLSSLVPPAALAEPTPASAVPGQVPPISPSPPATATSVTESHGDLPATLDGTWLALFHTPSSKGTMSQWQVLRFRHEETGWRVERAKRSFLKPGAKALQQANQSGEPLEPSDDLLADLSRRLPEAEFPSDADTFRSVVLRAASAFLPQPTPPPAAVGALFSIEMLEQPPEGGFVHAVSLYAHTVAPDRIEGDSTTLSLAAAGFGVVPLQSRARFRLVRLSPAQPTPADELTR